MHRLTNYKSSISVSFNVNMSCTYVEQEVASIVHVLIKTFLKMIQHSCQLEINNAKSYTLT